MDREVPTEKKESQHTGGKVGNVEATLRAEVDEAESPDDVNPARK